MNFPGNTTGSITFGTLGYCLDIPGNGTTCSKPSIGYELDINGLVGNKLPFEIPQVAVKWITYALFLHVVALILATGSAAFGLLAHVREMSMTCCSTCVSGFAAAVAMLAFIFDLVLFFVAKARINAVGTASMGNAIWLTLAAWVLLFFSGCFYTLGRCCASRRPRNQRDVENKYGGGGASNSRYDPPRDNDYADRMRLDAVKAEADRKARAKVKEGGLPAFSENEPLTAVIDGDHVYLDNDAGASSNAHTAVSGSTAGRKPSQHSLAHAKSATFAAGGYVQGAPGNRAVDEYYNPTQTPAPGPNTYPPQPQTAPYGASAYAAPQRQGSGYQPSSAPAVGVGGIYGGGYATTSPPPSQMLNVPGGYNDPYAPQGQAYGHTQGGSSYHTASGGHSQYPSTAGPAQTAGFAQYEAYEQPYSSPPQQPATSYYSPQPDAQYTAREHPAFLAPGLTSSPPPPAGYSSNALAPTALTTGYSPALTQSPPQQQQQRQPSYDAYNTAANHYNTDYIDDYGQPQQQRQYTLSGDGYGASSVPAPPPGEAPAYDPYAGAYGEQAVVASPVRGPREQPQSGYGRGGEEAPPPGYEQGAGGVQGRWGKQ
ncbi:hypothetical protein DFP72DRAFT_1174304 [Ephemerocybe angulata]|uniref:Pali-domain-containing protein n=1 Tax=Ephemerocybe angulata TaxID=980116 RepID=A0A8H6LY57_9AGAR|nr:hypothetical protein DFP72DRAFT_1174304 [Tulosesus angulatus]